MLNICYLTFRRAPKWHWFFESLFNQWEAKKPPIKFIIIDYYQREPDRREDIKQLAVRFASPVVHTEPKPTVWQGRHRLTSKDYFAAASTRNTGVCLAEDGHIVFVDDLSVLMPGWLNAVMESVRDGYIACGAFRKVKKLCVHGGNVVSFEDHPGGVDSRWPQGHGSRAVKCHPNWLFGASVAGPVEGFLKINGWPEMCDSTGLGMEDCHTGIALANNGYELKYDLRMLTYESEEDHFVDAPMLRMDKNRPGGVQTIVPGVEHPKEKGQVLVERLRKAHRFDNYFGAEGIRGLRQRVLAGEPFPIMTEPSVDWYDSQPLSQL